MRKVFAISFKIYSTAIEMKLKALFAFSIILFGSAANSKETKNTKEAYLLRLIREQADQAKDLLASHEVFNFQKRYLQGGESYTSNYVTKESYSSVRGYAQLLTELLDIFRNESYDRYQNQNVSYQNQPSSLQSPGQFQPSIPPRQGPKQNQSKQNKGENLNPQPEPPSNMPECNNGANQSHGNQSANQSAAGEAQSISNTSSQNQSSQNETSQMIQNQTQNESQSNQSENQTQNQTQKQNATNQSESESQNQSSNGGNEVQRVQGCINVSESDNICQQCNQYSWLDQASNVCVCVFVYKVEINPIQENNNQSSQEQNQTQPSQNQSANASSEASASASSNNGNNTSQSNASSSAQVNISNATQNNSQENQTLQEGQMNEQQGQTYQISIYTHLEINQAIYESLANSTDGTFACQDLLLFIFENETVLNQLQSQVDQVRCSINQIFYFAQPTGNDSYNNIIKLQNVSQEVLDAFLLDLIEFAFDYTAVNLNCYGAPELLVTFQGINCSDQLQQQYCIEQNQSANESSSQQNQSSISNTSISNNTENQNQSQSLQSGNQSEAQQEGNSSVQSVCLFNYNLSYFWDDLQNWTLSFSNFSLPIQYQGEYASELNQVDCGKILSLALNLTTNNDTSNIYSDQILNLCFINYSSMNQSQDNQSNSQAFLYIQIRNLSSDSIQGFLNESYFFVLNNIDFQFGNQSNCSSAQPFLLSAAAFNNQLSRRQQKLCLVKNCELCGESNQTCDKCVKNHVMISDSENDTNQCIPNPCNLSSSYNQSTNSCIPNNCSAGCQSCDANQSCLECSINYFKLYFDYTRKRTQRSPGQSFTCVQQCPVDFYTDYKDQECSICDPDCLQCQQNMFFKCSKARQYAFCTNKKAIVSSKNATQIQGQIKCANACPDGYYGFDGWCHKCSQNCKTCLSFSQCLTCPDYSALQNQSCIVPQCTLQEFIDFNGSCQACSQNCSQCAYSADNCSACGENQVLRNFQCINISNISSLQAQPVCNLGFFLNAQTNICQKCPNNCFNCSQAQNCSQCSPYSYKLYNETTDILTCSASCPQGYYGSNVDKICRKCSIQNCKVCSPESTCWSCQDGYYRSRSQCFSSCPSGQFIGQDFLKYYYCQSCPLSCTNCSSKNTCSSCSSQYIKVTSQYPDIDEGLVQRTLNVACVADSNSCPKGTYYDTQNNQCILCPRGCAACDQSGNCTQFCNLASQKVCEECLSRPQQCVKCSAGLVPQFNDQTGSYSCVQNCSSQGQYFDVQSQTCLPCQSNCQRCSNQTSCQACSSGFYLQTLESSQSCVQTCVAGYFAQQQSQKCQKCSKNCLTCTGASSCDRCDSNTQLDPQSGKCFCQLKYSAYLSTASRNIYLNLQNIAWDVSVLGLFSGQQRFNCSRVLEVQVVNSSQSFGSFNCSGSYSSQMNDANITIFNIPQSLLSQIRQQRVQLALVEGIYSANCVNSAQGPLTLSVSSDDLQLLGVQRDSDEVGSGQRRNLALLSEEETIAQVRYERDKALGLKFFGISVFVVILVLIGGYLGAKVKLAKKRRRAAAEKE